MFFNIWLEVVQILGDVDEREREKRRVFSYSSGAPAMVEKEYNNPLKKCQLTTTT